MLIRIAPLVAALLALPTGLVSAEEVKADAPPPPNSVAPRDGAEGPEDANEINICQLPPALFFGYTFEQLMTLDYPDEDYTGEETIDCTDDKQANNDLLDQLEEADTNDDGEVEQEEFDAWREEHFSTPAP